MVFKKVSLILSTAARQLVFMLSSNSKFGRFSFNSGLCLEAHWFPSFIVVHLLEILNIPELDPVVVAHAGHDLPTRVDVQALNREVAFVLTNHPAEPVGVKVEGSDMPIFAGS